MDLKLFFGLLMDEEFSKALDLANPQLLNQLINNDQDYYLTKHTYEDQIYIGKWVKASISLEELENIENHVMSILKQLLPSLSFTNKTLLLIPQSDDA